MGHQALIVATSPIQIRTRTITNPTGTTCGIRLQSTGLLNSIQGAGLSIITPIVGEWFQFPIAGVGSAYEAQMVTLSGTSWAGATTDTWLALSSTRDWYASGTPTAVSGRLEIRPAGGSSPIAIATFNFSNG